VKFIYRLTDLCEYCEKAKSLKQKINKIIKDENYEIKANYDLNELIQFLVEATSANRCEYSLVFEDLKMQELDVRFQKLKENISHIKDFEQILFHQNVARAQRMAYKNHHENLNQLKETLLIEIDFKQKIVIGMSPRQVNKEFYEQQVRSCLGKLLFLL